MKIIGYGTCLPKHTVNFDGQTRYRISGGESQLGLAVGAVNNALRKAELEIDDIDCIISASAIGMQPIPCTAALIHEEVAQGTAIPALDVNTTCTSFITALDIANLYLEAGRYKHILVVASEAGSIFLNPNQKESYELFSDGAACVIVAKSGNADQKIIHVMQKTWSEGAHTTEIRGGGAAFHSNRYSEKTKEDFMFDMKGKPVLALVAKKLPGMFEEFLQESGLDMDGIDMLIPHQASSALKFIMAKIGVPESKYIDVVKEYGNLVSVSVPFTLCLALEKQWVEEGQTVVLMGTAAGLTTNILALKI